MSLLEQIRQCAELLGGRLPFHARLQVQPRLEGKRLPRAHVQNQAMQRRQKMQVQGIRLSVLAHASRPRAENKNHKKIK